ncbi:sensor histidine kinase [Pedobacter panaciterrae]|uniref:histidine kinase n=1 Tax=Pedobacter panaciterrae TaxID=363849 RepID=A0ABU8NHH8_9SPHI|nr:HAMP domain-containing sensor histidine kinase [uncultured Pedobacter sp.]
MTSRLYKSIVLVSFLILIVVQARLIYNTYTLRDRDFNLKEKTLLNDEYGRSIPADKVYPGGGKIIDSILSRNMPNLRAAYLKDKKTFDQLAMRVSDTLFNVLRMKSNMDSVFKSIVIRNSLDTNMRYLLTFQSIEINFDNRIGDIFIFDSKKAFFKEKNKANYGAIIDGELANPTPQNRVTNLSVSDKLKYDYRVTFSLFADHPYRMLRVAYQMLPTFSLVAICILITVGINYYTYINWMRQKKEAEIKSDFLNSIKHEFNTPITTILVASKSLDDDVVLNDRPRVKALVHIVERQARRLESHINQMLELSVLKKKANLVETDLNYSVMVLINDYKVKLSPSDRITFDPYSAEILVRIDSFVFTTMLNNMFDNAFKYNHSAHKHVEVFIDEQQGNYVLHVADNGTGIEDDVKEKIFDKFFRSNQDSTIPGLGLGLYYVKECLDIHGWRMDVKTKIGEGTEFMVYI